MKKALIFIGGAVTGIVLTFLVFFIIGQRNSSNDDFVLFEEEGRVISTNSFKVFQVLDSGDALAKEVKEIGHNVTIPTGLTVLFYSDDGYTYYDDQIIRVPTGKCVRQIGVFRYTSKAEIEKTVPIVGIRNK